MLILVLVLTPPLHGISRSIIKPWVVFHVERGLTWVTLAQKNQRSVLTVLSTMSCFTVSISFYISFLPLLMWVSDFCHSEQHPTVDTSIHKQACHPQNAVLLYEACPSPDLPLLSFRLMHLLDGSKLQEQKQDRDKSRILPSRQVSKT